ncbi:MAG: glycosyltransferase [Bacilli bacterium]|nr:glycosyltransferase [Bacilli bacterium]
MKDISFIVPCYNSQDYMEHCIDSLLPGGDQVEIIIIDDGSKDNTAKIADKYAKKYPKIVKVRHQENGGHGEGINQGIKMAEGRYVKVVDSDDWVDEKAYKTLLKKITKINSDVVITNYVYTYTDGRTNQVIDFSNVFPDNIESIWKDIKKFKTHQFLMIHSVMFKKELLDEAKIDLPLKTFYEDNLYVYLGLRYVKTIYYMNLNLYNYFIGRPDQSVQEASLIKRNSHQALISTLTATVYNLDELEDKKQKKAMLRHCAMVVSLGSTFTRLAKNKEGNELYKKMWKEIKEKNPTMYKKMRSLTNMSGWASLPGPLGAALTRVGYRIAHKIVKFN